MTQNLNNDATPVAKDTVIVLSGGLDSTTMLYEFHERIAVAITFNYGSNHNEREARWAREHCERLGIEHIEIQLGFMSQYFNSALLSGAEAVPDGHYADENMRATIVPFRNGIMLAIAAGLAESRHLTHLMLANHSGDHFIYPDCRPEFVDAMSSAISSGTLDGITILAPYTHISKADIVRRGAALGIDYTETYSCYKGGEVHCGSCGTCVERREAFADAGVEDKTTYLH